MPSVGDDEVGGGAQAWVLCTRAETLLAMNRAAEAADVARQAIATSPTFVRAHVLLSWSLTQLDRPQEALEAARQALAIDPESANAHQRAAQAYGAVGKHQDAHWSAMEAVRLAPYLSWTWETLAYAEVDRGKIKQGLAAADKVIEMAPDSSDGYNVKAYALLHKGKFQEAEENCRKALAIDPEHPQALQNLGFALARQRGRENEALDQARAAVQLNPGDKTAVANAAAIAGTVGGFILLKGGASFFLKWAALSSVLRTNGGSLGWILVVVGLVLVGYGAYKAYRRSKLTEENRQLAETLKSYEQRRWAFTRHLTSINIGAGSLAIGGSLIAFV